MLPVIDVDNSTKLDYTVTVLHSPIATKHRESETQIQSITTILGTTDDANLQIAYVHERPLRTPPRFSTRPAYESQNSS